MLKNEIIHIYEEVISWKTTTKTITGTIITIITKITTIKTIKTITRTRTITTIIITTIITNGFIYLCIVTYRILYLMQHKVATILVYPALLPLCLRLHIFSCLSSSNL